jgi:5-methylcytosine-specific restriction endonuclease McrA
MNSTQTSVLVLNKYWQAVDIKSPQDALSEMVAEKVLALNIINSEILEPLSWNKWVELPYDDNSEYVRTVNKKIKIPKIIISKNLNFVPRKKVRFTSHNIWRRDNYICQYTGEPLTPKTGNIDHIIPRSRGGKSTWTNCVLCHKHVNSKKGDKTPQEAGLSLIKQPTEPPSLPATFYINNPNNIKEWELFLISK